MRTRSNQARARTGDDVVGWRRDQLAAAGFEEGLAAAVASDPRWDIHATLELVERGCPPGLAVRILAPVDIPEASP